MGKSIHIGNLFTSRSSLLAGKMSGHAYEYIDMEDRSYDDVAAPDQPEGEVQYLQPAGLPAVYLHPPIEDIQEDDTTTGHIQLPTQSRNPSICCTWERKIIIGLSVLVVVLLLGGIGMGVFAFYGRGDGENIGYGWSEWGSWSSCLSCQQERVRSCNVPDGHHDKLDCPGHDRETRNCSVGPADPCHQAAVCYLPYETFSESYRRENVGHQENCDMDKVDGTSWYRFKLGTGENGVIEHCPKPGTCGTTAPMWMDSTHPQHYGEVKNVTMAASLDIGVDNCFSWSGNASVTKCFNDGEPFYLYQLWKPPTCLLSYCAQKYDL